MTSTFSYSTSSTFTRTDAEYLASKVAAELRQLNLLYRNGPTDTGIVDYVTELVVLVLYGYLTFIQYGYKKCGQWVVALRYDVGSAGTVIRDDRPGQVPAYADVNGATFSSFLMLNDRWSTLSNADQTRIENMIPIRRSEGYEPNGSWSFDRSYSRNGVSLNRGVTGQ